MFRRISARAIRLLVGASLLTMALTLASPVEVANAASVSWTNNACPVGTLYSLIGTFLVSPSGTYTTSFSVKDLTNGHTFIGFSGIPQSFSGPHPFGNGSAIITSTSDIVVVTLTLNGTQFTDYPCGKPNTLNFTDGRCNQEPYQSVAVYPDGKGGYNFYALFNGVGYFAMHVTEQNLDDNPDTGVTHKIAEAKGVQLFRLAGGGLQVNRMGKDNKMYSFNIGTCGAMED